MHEPKPDAEPTALIEKFTGASDRPGRSALEGDLPCGVAHRWLARTTPCGETLRAVPPRDTSRERPGRGISLPLNIPATPSPSSPSSGCGLRSDVVREPPEPGFNGLDVAALRPVRIPSRTKNRAAGIAPVAFFRQCVAA